MNLLCISSAQLNETIWYEKESIMPLCMVIGIKVQTTLTMRKCASLRLSQSNALKHNELKKIYQNRVWRRHAHITATSIQDERVKERFRTAARVGYLKGKFVLSLVMCRCNATPVDWTLVSHFHLNFNSSWTDFGIIEYAQKRTVS